MKSRPPRSATNREAALWCVRQLCAQGHQALFAGGCVRDLLLKHEPKDHDVATDARPDVVVQLFHRTRSVGKLFGVILVGVRRHWIEVATFRSDGSYGDGRRPDTVRFTSAAEDARRRDFTINGMFYVPEQVTVLDLVGGQEDLKRRVIRAIGDPAARFAEDHLRLLRAIRFAARLNFDVEAKTWTAIRDAAPLLRRISAERVHDELSRMLTDAGRQRAWELLREAGLVPHLWDGADRTLARTPSVAELLGRLPDCVSFELVLAVLALPSPDEARHIGRQLRTSNDHADAAVWLVQHHADADEPARLSLAELKRLMAGPAFDDLLQLLRARLDASGKDDSAWRKLRDRAAAVAPEQVTPPPLVTGSDLIQRALGPGPAFGGLLDAVYDAQLNEEIQDRPAALAMLDRLLQQRRSSPIDDPAGQARQ